MKRIVLKKLELTNYRNIDHAVYEFDGDCKIVGENRVGKTNTLESVMYLLTDKLLNGSSDLQGIKPLADTKRVVCVTGTFAIEDQESGESKEVVLSKEYGEMWVKTRGTGDLVMKGHYTNYFYNGVKQSTIKAYAKLFADDFGISQDQTATVDYIRLAMDPFYLCNLGETDDWKSLREFIIKLVGDVKDSDVFEKEPSLKNIEKGLARVGGRIDQLKKQLTQEKDNIQNSIIADDGKIMFLEQTERPTDEELSVARRAIEEHDANIVSIKANVGMDVASSLIANKLSEAKSELLKAIDEEKSVKSPSESEIETLQLQKSELLKKQNELLSSKSEVTSSINSTDYAISSIESKLSDCQQLRNELIDSLNEIQSQINNPKVDTVCPTCGKPLDDNVVSESVSKLRDRLESKKSELIQKGIKNKETIDECSSEIEKKRVELESFKSRLAEIESKFDDAVKAVSDADSKIDALRASQTPKSDSQKIVDLKDKIEKLNQELIQSKNEFQNGQKSANEAIMAEEDAKKDFQKVVDAYNYWVRQQKELESARDEREKHSKSLIDTEQKIEMVARFIYVKLRMLDENVSKVFGGIRFQLIRENINGGYDPVCKAYIYDTEKCESTNVLWKSGSKSERIATGISVAEKVKEALGMSSLPFLFDEGGEVSAETFRNRLKTESQIICVEVKDDIMSPTVIKI